MSETVYIMIDENWPEGSAGEQAAWARRSEDGSVLEKGIVKNIRAIPQAGFYEVILPAGSVLLTTVQPPERNIRRFLNALPNAIEDQMSVDAEKLHVAAGEKQPDGSLPVAVTDRAWIEKVLAAFTDQGINVSSITVETLVIPIQKGEWSVLKRGSGYYVRTGDFSGMPLDSARGDAAPIALKTLLAEAREKNEAPGHISFFSDGTANTPDLGKWSSELGVRFKEPYPWSIDMAIAEAAAGARINFLQGELAPSFSLADAAPKLKLAAVLALAVVFIQLVGVVGEWAILKYKTTMKQNEINVMFKTAFPEAKAVVDAPLQARRNLMKLRSRTGEYDKNDFIPLMAAVSPLLAPNVKVGKIKFKTGALELELVFKSKENMKSTLNRMRGTGLSVTLNKTEGVQDGTLAKVTVTRS